MEERIKSPSEDEMRSECDFSRMRIVARGIGRKAPQTNLDREGKMVMGEVRIKVALTNAGDEVMVRRGLLAAEKTRNYEADAWVDTGAVKSALPIHVVQSLGLATVGKTRAGDKDQMKPPRRSPAASNPPRGGAFVNERSDKQPSGI